MPEATVEAVGVASRRAAWATVRRVHRDGAWAPRALDAVLRRSDLDARDRSFAANLAYETLRWEGTLDWALARVLTRPLAQVEPELLDVLRIGAWQLLRGAVPDSAAVGTAVELARAVVGPRGTGFTNGVLRALARAELRWPDEGTDEGLGLAVGYPTWVVVEARRTFGDRARAVLEAGNAAPGLTLRAADRDGVLVELLAAGLDAAPGGLDESIRVPGGDPARIPAVAEGRATPQDEASMVVVRAVEEALGGLDGAVVVDLASSPGGKAAHLAARGARVVATDLLPGRARLVVETAARLGVADRVAVAAADAARPPLRPSSFDAVLLDAPCTGLGVVRRRPELRWRRTADDPARLGALQRSLLTAAAGLVRPGGALVYSVCTWTLAETADVASPFLAIEGDRFRPAPRAVTPGRGSAIGPGVLLDPDRDGTDGMYVVGLQRNLRG